MSFISVEPQPRAVLESHNDSLLTQFDTQLRVVADRYLAFFRERQRIEATYIDSLRKLHREAEDVNTSLGPHAEPTTTKTAWDKVRDNLGRDADVRQGFMDILTNDVIKPLEILKESNDEIGKRMKDNLNMSASAYADYAENTVLKLQQAYSRKYQPQQHPQSTNASGHPQDDRNKRSRSVLSALFPRSRREDQRELEPAKAAPSDEVSDEDCREAVSSLNKLRIFRAENIGDGYDCLEELTFAPTLKNVLVKYMDGMIKTFATHGDIAKSTGTEVENALDGIDASDLRVSFRRALSLSTPPPTLYHNYRSGGYSKLVFGVPLVNHGISEDNVPKVMKICIEEIEKRGLTVDRIYSSDSIRGTAVQNTAVRKLLRRFESETSFSFTSTDDIHTVAALLKRYLYDLPEPLLTLSWKEYKHYTQERDEYTKSHFSLLRSKIRELHPVHRASLEALLRHLLLVAAHSVRNGMSVKTLSSQLCGYVLGFDTVAAGGIHVKAPVLEVLIQNVQTLFDERPSQSPPLPSSEIAETASSYTYTSPLFSSPELYQFATVQATGSTPRQRLGFVGGTPTSTQSSFSSSPSDGSEGSRLTPQYTLPSLLLELSSSSTLTEGVETNTQEQLIPEARGTKAIKTLPNSTPLRVPHSLPETVRSSSSGFPLSSATSLNTRLWGSS